jgi:hypothetical protein
MPLLVLAEVVTTVADQEAIQTERWVSNINVALFVSIVILIAFTLSIRFIARRLTRPCQWCTEFIPKRAKVCPKCGKVVTPPA